MPSNRWTPAEDKFLRDNAGELSRRDMSSRLGRSYGAVKARLSALGVEGARMDRPWTEEEDAIIRELYPNTPTDEIRIPGRNAEGIRSRAARLNVRKNKGMSRWSHR